MLCSQAGVSIPQAVSTVATDFTQEANIQRFDIVSIPQAVSTVATGQRPLVDRRDYLNCFNTASGKHCCNLSNMTQKSTAL